MDNVRKFNIQLFLDFRWFYSNICEHLLYFHNHNRPFLHDAVTFSGHYAKFGKDLNYRVGRENICKTDFGERRSPQEKRKDKNAKR